jgi:AcrR family transcriptional regulator
MPKDTFFNLNPYKKERIFQAAVDEFAQHTYNEAKLSRIIKAANIPRGSFYQYFKDKADLYKYLFKVMSEHKLEYLGEEVNNPDEIPFIELFRRLMRSGLKFAVDNPDYIKITRNLMSNRGKDIFKEVMGDGLSLARQYYSSYIEIDKKHGRIRDDVDTILLADIVLETTTNLSFLELTQSKDVDINRMFQRMEEFINILQKGIA